MFIFLPIGTARQSRKVQIQVQKAALTNSFTKTNFFWFVLHCSYGKKHANIKIYSKKTKPLIVMLTF